MTVSAWGLSDLVQLLVFCTEPRRVKVSSGDLFAGAIEELGGQLDRLEGMEWIGRGSTVEHRITRAQRAASESWFLDISGRSSPVSSLTESGRRWLELSGSERARDYLEPLRQAMTEEVDDAWGAQGLYLTQRDRLDAFRSLEGAVPMEDFFASQAQGQNPLKRSAERTRALTDEACKRLEDRWWSGLREILVDTLLPSGVVRCANEGERIMIELTPAGRWALGLVDEFEWDEGVEADAFYVQPDFEVVFLAPSPSLEAEVGRFAERQGKGVGALFRLTRSSVQAAFHGGLSAEDMLSTLTGKSSTPLPDNVAREIDSWCGACVQLTWQPTSLVRCPDAETAARVLAAGRGKLERISDTVLALVDPKKRGAVTVACKKEGVFLEGAESESKRLKSRLW